MDNSARLHSLPDGQAAWVHHWPTASAPVAALQIVHGMAEHGARYARLGRQLNVLGIAVYAQDLPGHGRTAGSTAALGHFDEDSRWSVALAAINGVRGLVEHSHPGLPLFVLGHSMGSFLLQHYLVEHGEGLAGAVLSASSASMGPLRGLGERLMRLEAWLFGADHRSALAAQLTFKDFNRRFRPNRTTSDWLSRDPDEVDAYVADPYCGFRCSASLWAQLLMAGASLTQPERLARLPPGLPLLLLAGGADPVCQNGLGSEQLADIYRKAGLESVQSKVYAQARHELFNETCRDEVMEDLGKWLSQRLGAGTT